MKKQLSVTLEESIIARVEAEKPTYKIPPSLSAVIEDLLKEALDTRDAARRKE